MSKIYFFVSILFFQPLFTLAQNCDNALRGIVMDEAGSTLPGATVRISDTEMVVSTNNGEFTFKNLCDKTVAITVEYVGYETQVVQVKTTQKRVITIKLKSSTTQLQDIVVEGEKRMSGASQTTSVLSSDELTVMHGRPLGESLKEIPGVSAIQTGPSIFKPVIHGLHSQRILILNNGIRQEGQQWGIEHAPEVDPFIASSLEVVKGAETVRYGSDAIGGVIIVNPPPLHEVHESGGELNFGLMSNNRMAVISAMVEGNFAKHDNWTWRLQGSGKKGGDYHAADYNLSNTGTEEFNFSGAIGFSESHHGLEIYGSSFNNNIGILRAAHTGNQEDLQSSIISSRPWYVKDFSYDLENPRQKINHHLLKIKSFFDLSNFGRINILYGAQYNQRKEFDVRRGGRSDRPALSMNLISNILDVSLDHEKGGHSGSIGVNGSLKFNNNETGITGIRPLIPDYDQASAAIFVFEKLKKGKWTFEAGARYDHQYLQVLTFDTLNTLVKPSFNFNLFSGTIGVSHNFNEHWRYLSNLGISSRPPHVSELYAEGLHHGTGSIEEGLMRPNGEVLTDDRFIRKEISRKWINTLQYGSEKLSLDFSVYYNQISNYVFIRPYETRLTIRGYFPVFRFDQTDALLMGADAGLKWKASKRFEYASKISLIHASDIKTDDKLIFIPPALIDNSVTLHFPSVLTLKKLYITLSAPATLKQSRAPRTVYPEQIREDNSTKVFDLAPAPDAYILLNARIGFEIPIQERVISISLSGENLLNKSYRNYMNRLRYFADDIGRNIILRFSYNFHKH